MLCYRQQNRLPPYVGIPNLLLRIPEILVQLDDTLVEILNLGKNLGSLLFLGGADISMFCDLVLES